MDTFYFSAFLRTKNCRVIHNSLTSMKYFFIEYYFYEIPFFTIFCILYCHYILICYALFNFISFYSIFSFLSSSYLFVLFLPFLPSGMVIEAEQLDLSGQVQGLCFIDPNGIVHVRTYGMLLSVLKVFCRLFKINIIYHIFLFIFIYFIFSAYSQLYICLL